MPRIRKNEKMVMGVYCGRCGRLLETMFIYDNNDITIYADPCLECREEDKEEAIKDQGETKCQA